jgi:hypothetical protein
MHLLKAEGKSSRNSSTASLTLCGLTIRISFLKMELKIVF